MIQPRILVAGIGNIFLGDDAFGVEVAQRLAQRAWPAEVRIVDFGIRGLDLTYALLDSYEAVLLIDATPRGGAPGTLYVLEPDRPAETEIGSPGETMEGHSMDPAKVLRLAAAMGARIERLLLVGCEPARTDDYEEMARGLSPPVQAAVEEAIPLIELLVDRLLRGDPVESH
jgi:hydrogenase maturation protease